MKYTFHAPWRYANALGRFLFCILTISLLSGQSLSAEAYRLGAGDRITVRIVVWDTIELDFLSYEEIGGEYAVGSDGTVLMPPIGSVPAAGKSVAELAGEVTAALQSQLGLAKPPSASIEISAFRPVYVLGDVNQPGPYAFAPGLNVQQALALAGGVESALDAESDGQSSAIRLAGTLREVATTLSREQIRQERLRAEMEGRLDFAVPEAVRHPGGTAARAAAVEHEQSLFLSRREALKRQLEALTDSQALLETEIAALEEKRSGQQRQLELVRERAANLETLLERGVVRSPELVTLQGRLIDLENRELDTETAIFRARQAIADLERDRIDLEANRRLEVLRELQQTGVQIEQLTLRRDTTLQLLSGAEALLLETTDVPLFRTSYRITRSDPDRREIFVAEPDTQLVPSDVLEVLVLPIEESG